MDLQKILADHKCWLETNKKMGAKADLSYADLSEVELRYADLRYADLYRVNFAYADLRSADFSYANLRGAEFFFGKLHRANFRGADLFNTDFNHADLQYTIFSRAKGFVLLPAQDHRGHLCPHAILKEDGWKIRAGYHFFTIEEAKTHWGEGYKGNREIGDMYLHAVEWLERKLERESE